MNFKSGDIVKRKSYNKDILFTIDRIIIDRNGNSAILKGITKRLEANAPLADLEMADSYEVERKVRSIDNRLDERAKEYLQKTKETRFNSPYMYTGRILHLDGDTSEEKQNKCLYISVFRG